MKTADSHTLLTEYVRSGSEAAFRELVSRYLDLVYSTAFRLVGGDIHSAEDVTQMVFSTLAQKARTLSSEPMLGGWLHRHTCYVASTTRRTERRRQERERQAMELNALEDHTQANLARVAPVLDEAINQLGTEDRAAILLRFYEQRDFRSLGEVLGSSEDAARMRVSRALDKLHSLLKHRGGTLSATALGSVLAAEAVTAAPAGLGLSISGIALASAAAGGGTALTLLNVMGITKLKLGVISAVVVAGMATPLMLQHQAQIRHRQDEQALRQQVAQLAAENQRLSNLVASANASHAPASDQLSELLRLRGEVGLLREHKSKAERLQEENRRLQAGLTASKEARQAATPPTPFSAAVPKESWAFAGYATPEAALQTIVWAWSNHDTEALLASLTPEGRKQFEQAFKGQPASEAFTAHPIDISKASGYQIRKKEISENEVACELAFALPFDLGFAKEFTMKRVGSEWKTEW